MRPLGFMAQDSPPVAITPLTMGALRLTDEHARREGATLCAFVFAVNLEVAYVYINVCLSP